MPEGLVMLRKLRPSTVGYIVLLLGQHWCASQPLSVCLAFRIPAWMESVCNTFVSQPQSEQGTHPKKTAAVIRVLLAVGAGL